MKRALLLVLLLTACRTFQPAKTPEGALVELAPSEFPSFADDLDFAELDVAIGHSLAHYSRMLRTTPDASLRFGTERVPVSQIAASLDRFRAIVALHPSPEELRATLQREFRVFQSTGLNRDRDVLFTGYYLPEVRGSLTETPPYNVPIYGVPSDLVLVRSKDFGQLRGEDLIGRLVGNTLKPYANRADIESGALKGKNLELVWLDSAVDAFFMEIQGSGVVRFADGTTRVLSYAGKNGHPYVAIGQELIKRGALKREEVSMQSIRAWLDANPAERSNILNSNPSYVFFKLSDFAAGSLGAPVTAGRTIATDTRVFPKGALCFIETERLESAASTEWRKYSRFVLDQDTGGAIRTAGRVDVFWGSGEYAAAAAGNSKHNGKLYYLLLKTLESGSNVGASQN
jgi:membrane-bound lytic murein transglycosylase A